MEFEPFPKIARLRRPFTITEKIDGTNASILIPEAPDSGIQAASRSRLVTPGKSTDNHGFAQWVYDNEYELVEILGPGRHFGEWWGLGIQRGYDMPFKNFSLFNTSRWGELSEIVGGVPLCSVPVLAEGDIFDSRHVSAAVDRLYFHGSIAAPGFKNPEGVVVYHHASNELFKQTVVGDQIPKGFVAR